MSNTIKFQAGTTYKMTFISDSDLKVPVKVIKRTEKSITIIESGKKVNRKIYTDMQGIEYAYPLGLYSFAPSITADRTHN